MLWYVFAEWVTRKASTKLNIKPLNAAINNTHKPATYQKASSNLHPKDQGTTASLEYYSIHVYKS